VSCCLGGPTLEVVLEKGAGGKKLGFSVVGGVDTPPPRGPLGIYVKTVVEGGLAAECGNIREGLPWLVTFT